MKLRLVTALAWAFLAAGMAIGQSNQVLDVLLSQQSAAYAQTAYLALVGGSRIPESASPSEAFDLALSKGWLPKGATPEASIDIEAFSYLAMRALGFPGGLGWTIFHGRRYAYRELVAQGIANASGGGRRLISGVEVVRMLGKMGTAMGGEK